MSLESDLEAMEFSKREIRKILRNPRRRYTIHYIKRNGGEAPLDEVVDKVTEWENNGTEVERSAPERKSVYSSLYQRHLPKLVDMGILSYDTVERKLALTDAGDRLVLQMPTERHDCRSFSSLFLGMGSLSTLVLVLAWVGQLPTSFMFTFLGVLLVVFLVLSSFQIREYNSWKQKFERKGPDYIVEIDDE